MDSYAKQGQEIFQKKLQNDYESIDEVNRKIVESLVIAKKNQISSKNVETVHDAPTMKKQGTDICT